MGGPSTRPTKFYLILLGCVIISGAFLVICEAPLRSIYLAGSTYVREAVLVLHPTKNVTVMSDGKIGLANSTSRSTFSKVLGSFDWDRYMKVVNEKNIREIDISSEKLIQQLMYFMVMEPKVPVNSECTAPRLAPLEELNCSNPSFGTAFTGSLNKKTPKIGILIQFGFEVDVLEIYLNEIYDLVDYFFILEATRSHFRTFRKPLLWEKVKNQERFAKFADKIVHFIVDDAENSEATQFFKTNNINRMESNIWTMENLQERLRWNKFLKWNAGEDFFGDDDLIGFGDVDEIPARKMVHMLKHCATKPGSIDVGIWFPYGNIKYAYATDHPVQGHKYSLGDPTFFTLKFAHEFSKSKPGSFPTRQRGKGNNFILGGIHMTHYGYLPLLLLQEITCSECGIWPVTEIGKIKEKIRNDQIREMEIKHGAVPTVFLNRLISLSEIEEEMKDIAILPWFYDCNRNRYPAWEGNHDIRLN